VKGAPPLFQEALVGHLVGEGVLEGVLKVGEEPGLVEELGGLELAEAPAQTWVILRDLKPTDEAAGSISLEASSCDDSSLQSEHVGGVLREPLLLHGVLQR
jgi:hypothetical protein